MTEEISIKFYRVNQCGYFQRGNNNPLFANLGSTLESLYSWVKKKKTTISDTQTFPSNDGDSFLPVYCYDIVKNNNDYLLVTWNETETMEGEFASIDANELTGHAKIVTKRFSDNSTPGYPCYFWFIPDENSFATIRLKGRLTGNPEMNKFMQGFLERFSRWVQINDGDERSLDTEILGYANDSESKIHKDVVVRFKTLLLRRKGEIDYIYTNREKIRKIIRRDKYVSTIQQKKTLIQAIFKNFGIANSNAHCQEDTKFKYELSITPKEDELNQIIQNWGNNEQENNKNESWSDIGFEFEGEASVKWLGSSLVKGKYDMDINLNEPKPIANPNSLLKFLLTKKDDLLRSIQESED